MFILFTIVSVVFTSASNSQEAGPSMPVPGLASIVAKWQLQRDRLTANGAAVVTYLATSRPPSGNVTEAEFRRIWSQNELVDSKQLDAVAKMLDATLNVGTTGFAETTLTVADANFRNDVSHGGLVRSTVRNNDVEIYVRPRIKQVHIYNAGEMQTSSRTLSRLTYLPSGTAPWTDYTTDVRDDNTTKIVSPDGRRMLVVNSSSGFVVESSYRSITRDNSAIKLVELQSAPIDPTADILFPRVRASATFRDDVLSEFEICVIVEIELNAEVPASIFTVNASKGTLLLDHRSDLQNPALLRLDEASADVLEAIDDPQSRNVRQEKPNS